VKSKVKVKEIKPNLSLDEYAEISVLFGMCLANQNIEGKGIASHLKKIQVLVKNG